jgi:hypothetical protein
METRTYNYGETPAEVIRNAHDTRFTPHDLEVNIKHENDMPPWERVLCVLPDTDDLLTLLDALNVAHEATRGEYERGIDQPHLGYAELRISILAALGIEEA